MSRVLTANSHQVKIMLVMRYHSCGSWWISTSRSKIINNIAYSAPNKHQQRSNISVWPVNRNSASAIVLNSFNTRVQFIAIIRVALTGGSIYGCSKAPKPFHHHVIHHIHLIEHTVTVLIWSYLAKIQINVQNISTIYNLTLANLLLQSLLRCCYFQINIDTKLFGILNELYSFDPHVTAFDN